MLISDYFPLAGGLGALLGVGLTLFISGRRERAKQDRERVDATRTEMRKTAAELLGAMYEFAASADTLGGKIDDREPIDEASVRHEAIIVRARSLFMGVRLLTDDSRLIEPLNEVILAFQAVNDQIVDQEARKQARERFTEAMTGLINGLYTVAVPTDLIKARRKAVTWLDRMRWDQEERNRRRQLRAIFDRDTGNQSGQGG